MAILDCSTINDEGGVDAIFDAINENTSARGGNVVYNDQSAASANAALVNQMLQDNTSVIIDSTDSDGIVYVDEPIVVPSDTSFITNGITFKTIDGIPAFHVIVNEALNNPFVDAEITDITNNIATVTLAAHGFDRQTCVVLQEAGNPIIDFVYRISSIIDADTFTIRLLDSGISLVDGSVKLKRCDKDIKINTKVDYNDENTTLSGEYNAHASVFSCIADSDIVTTTLDSAKYGGQISGSIGCTVDTIAFSNSDMFKIYGPAKDLVVKARGEASDDCVTIQAKEPGQFIAYQPTVGNILNVKVYDSSCIQNTSHSHGGCYVVYSDDEYVTDDILWSNISADSNTAPVLQIKPGNTFLAEDSLIRRVTVDKISGGTITTSIKVQADVSALTVKGMNFGVMNQDSRLLEHEAGVIDTLVFEGTGINSGIYSSTSQYLLQTSSEIKNLEVNNLSMKGTVANDEIKVLQLAAGADVKTITFNGGYYDNISTLVRADSGSLLDRVVLNSVSTDSVTYLVNSVVDTYVLMIGMNPVNPFGLILGVSGANIGLEMIGSKSESGKVFKTFTTGSITPYSDSILLDITSGDVLRANGAKCTTTAIAGLIPAGTIVISDGVKWLNVTDLTQTYTI